MCTHSNPRSLPGYGDNCDYQIITESVNIVCNNIAPCISCIKTVENEDYCSYCDTPSVVKHIQSGEGVIISNNYLHICFNCRHTAHWICHAGESLMDPVDVMELTSIKCIQCKSMIKNNENIIRYIPYSPLHTNHTPLIQDLHRVITDCNNMESGYFKTQKFVKFLDHIVLNITSYDKFKTRELECNILSRLLDLGNILGSEVTRKYMKLLF